MERRWRRSGSLRCPRLCLRSLLASPFQALARPEPPRGRREERRGGQAACARYGGGPSGLAIEKQLALVGLENGCHPRSRGLRWPDLGPPRRSLNSEIGLKRSRGFDRLKERDDPRRLNADRVEAAAQRSGAGSADSGDWSACLFDVNPGVGRNDRPAVRERGRLGDARLLNDPNRQRSVGYRDGRNLHVLTDDDRPGPRVENDARGHVWLDLQFPDLGHKPCERDTARAEQFYSPAVDFVGRMGAESLTGIGVDRIDDPHRGRVVRVFQFEHGTQFVGERWKFVLNDCAIWNAAGGRDALRQRLALTGGFEPGHRDCALSIRVYGSVR